MALRLTQITTLHSEISEIYRYSGEEGRLFDLKTNGSRSQEQGLG